ncbi:hypothetical protein E2I00_010851, partial [Balaenoptera physalus]
VNEINGYGNFIREAQPGRISALEICRRTEKAVPHLDAEESLFLLPSTLASPQWKRRKLAGKEFCTGAGLGPRAPQRVSSGLLVLGFWPLGAASTATEGSGSGDPKRLAPPTQPQSHPENTGVKPTEAGRGVQLTEVHGGKVPGNCFHKDPGFPGRHGNPGVPSTSLNHRAPGGQSPRTFAAGPEACKALPSFTLGFPEPLQWVQHGRD